MFYFFYLLNCGLFFFTTLLELNFFVRHLLSLKHFSWLGSGHAKTLNRKLFCHSDEYFLLCFDTVLVCIDRKMFLFLLFFLCGLILM